MTNNKKEFNTASIVCGNSNIMEAFITDDSIQFNESYIITGEKLFADEIYAMYDLTIMGDVQAKKLIVNGRLHVSGNICVEYIQCMQGITCSGKIQCKNMVCDTDVMARIVAADTIEVYGSVIVSESINVDDNCIVDSNVLAGEGVSGAGAIKADNIMTIDYFDFDGNVSAKVFEMATMYKTIINTEKDDANISLNNIVDDLKLFYDLCIEKLVENEEDSIIRILEECSQVQKESFSEISFLFGEIVRISYLDKIENLMDYLLVIYANYVLPEKLRSYETIEHVFSKFLDEVDVYELEFSVNNNYEFMIALKIVDDYFKNDDEIADKVFSFIGIRYRTVKKQLEGMSG